VIQIRETDAYAGRFARLKDREARARILVRIRRLSLGNPGDAKPVGEGVSESADRLRTGISHLFLAAGRRADRPSRRRRQERASVQHPRGTRIGTNHPETR
jgi:putative addiction module killer protein